jgi:hypothetical protein
VKAGRQQKFDSIRHLLEELSLELGVTDPVSGTVVFEKHMS